MRKRILSILLTAAMLLGFVPSVVFPALAATKTDTLAVSDSVVRVADAADSSVNFTLTNASSYINPSFTVYWRDTCTTGDLLTDVTVTLSGSTLTLERATYAVVGQEYFVTATEPGKGESDPLRLSAVLPESSDNTLSSLTLSAGKWIADFSRHIGFFEIIVPNSVASLDITPTVNTTGATLTTHPDGTPITSGSPITVPLNEGKNTVNIQVIPKDGISAPKIYTLTIYRESAPEAPQFVTNVNGNFLCANGSSIIVTEGTTPGSTSVYWDKGSIGTYEPGTDTPVANATDLPASSAFNIYAGSDGSIKGKGYTAGAQSITCTGGTLSYILGGNRYVAIPGNYDLTPISNDLTINVGGTTKVTGGIHASGENGSNAATNMAIGSITVNVSDDADIDIIGTLQFGWRICNETVVNIRGGNIRFLQQLKNGIGFARSPSNGTINISGKTKIQQVQYSDTKDQYLHIVGALDSETRIGVTAPGMAAGSLVAVADDESYVSAANFVPLVAINNPQPNTSIGIEKDNVNIKLNNDPAPRLTAISSSDFTNHADTSMPLKPTFSYDQLNYQALVAKSKTSFTLSLSFTAGASLTVTKGSDTMTPSTTSATENTYVIPYNASSTTLSIETSKAGSASSTYTLTVTPPSSNADLTALSLSDATLNEVFSSASTTYTADVAYAVPSVTISCTTSDPAATVTYAKNGSPYGNTIVLDVGDNTLSAIVTAHDGTVKTYTIVVTRADDAPSTDATLSALSLSQGSLTPSFTSGTHSYTATVASTVPSTKVRPTVTDTNATVTVNGALVLSGTESNSIALSPGSNTILVEVTAQSGAKTTYTVTVTRELSPSATPAVKTAPTDATVYKTALTQKDVTFTLADATDYTAPTWRVYAAASGGDALTSLHATADLTNPTDKKLTLSATANDLPAGDYYVSVQELGKAESGRLKLTVLDGAADFAWKVFVANVDISAGGHYKKHSNGSIVPTGNASCDADCNVHWDSNTSTMTLKDLSTSVPYSKESWPSAAIYMYEDVNIPVTIRKDVNFVISGDNAVLNDADSFGLHIGRYGGLGNAHFSGSGKFVTSGNFAAAYLPGNTEISGDGIYEFNVTNARSSDVGIQTGKIVLKDTVQVTSKGGNYGVHIQKGLSVASGASLTSIGTVGGFIANPKITALSSIVPQISADNGATWTNGVFARNVFTTAYNGETDFFTAKTDTAGAVSTWVKVSNLNVAPSEKPIPGGGGGGGGGGPVADDSITVDGKTENIGKSETTGDTTTVVVDSDKLGNSIEKASKDSQVVVAVETDKNIGQVQFAVKNVEDMAQKGMTLVVQVGTVSYELPTTAVDTKAITAALGQTDTSKIPFTVTVRTEKPVTIPGVETVGNPMQFTVSATYNGKTTTVNVFRAFVPRTCEISAEQAQRITTAVVYEADGSIRHVPTFVFQKNGKYYATINSRTNSSYVLIYNEQSFADSKGTWYEQIVAEMASRKIVTGVDAAHYEGERDITRAEFTAIVVRALGLPAQDSADFRDVPASAWYSATVATAVKYGIVEGVGNEQFEPLRAITREEAMAMVMRAGKLTPLLEKSAQNPGDAFADYALSSAWAKQAVDYNLANALIIGSNGQLRPQDNISRAEVATVILRLLQKSELVDIRSAT